MKAVFAHVDAGVLRQSAQDRERHRLQGMLDGLHISAPCLVTQFDMKKLIRVSFIRININSQIAFCFLIHFLERLMRKNIGMSSFIPMTPSDRSAIRDLGTVGLEIWSASFSTIGSRTKLLGTQSPLNPKMMRENRRMVTEKLVASWEIGLEMQIAWMDTLFCGQTPWWTSSRRILEPLYRRTTGNAKRLS